MKKFLLSIIIVFVVSGVWAQDTSQHLKFKNIPITGKMSNMISQLQTVGFEFDTKEGIYAKLDGKFANEDCEVAIVATPKSKEVYMIMVIFDNATSWYSLKSDYLELKKQLKEKYGVKPDSIERFISPYYEGDGYELSATSNDKCIYSSRYYLDNGEIVLNIANKHLTIYYIDKNGNKINEKEEQENTLDDL